MASSVVQIETCDAMFLTIQQVDDEDMLDFFRNPENCFWGLVSSVERNQGDKCWGEVKCKQKPNRTKLN